MAVVTVAGAAVAALLAITVATLVHPVGQGGHVYAMGNGKDHWPLLPR